MNANALPKVSRPSRSACDVAAGYFGLSRIRARRPPQKAGDNRKMVGLVFNSSLIVYGQPVGNAISLSVKPRH
jgi:hypothetical protein